MRALLASAAAVALACAGPQPAPERTAAAAAHPEPDPACRAAVAQAMLLTNVEQISLNVALLERDGDVAIVILGPKLTLAQEEEVRRAFPKCLWRPGAGGVRIGIVEFSRPR